MRNEFNVTGWFYKLGDLKLRKYLDIRRVGSDLKEPDLMVVMMNPGSSYPLDGIDDNDKPTAAEPDNTQDQIMKVMENTSLSYARVLNLSDLRTPDSKVLYDFIRSEESQNVNHSIFSAAREAELKSYFIEDVPVIYGWGVNPTLVPLAKLAIESLAITKPNGLLKQNKDFSYYHPLPRVYEKQVEWVQHVTRQLNQA